MTLDYILTISLKYILGLGFDNTIDQTKKTVKYSQITLYNYTIYCTISTRAQLLKRQHRRRTQKKSEMVTYNHTTQASRNI